MNGEITRLRGEIETYMASNNKLNAQIDNLKKEIAELDGQIKVQQKDKTELSAQNGILTQ